MAVYGPFVPNGDVAIGSWTDDAGGTTNLNTKIDEGTGAPTDTNDFIKAPNATNNADATFDLTGFPADFASIISCNWTIRIRQQGRVDDTVGIRGRIMAADGTTVLAAADSGGTFTVFSNPTTVTAFTNVGPTAFAYVNTAATKAQWDDARVTFRQTWTTSMGADPVHIEISAFQIAGDYNAVVPVTSEPGLHPIGQGMTGIQQALSAIEVGGTA